MPKKKTWLVKDKKTGRQIWVNYLTFRVGPPPEETRRMHDGKVWKEYKSRPGHPLSIDDNTPERIAFFLAKWSKKMGRELIAVPGPEIEYIDVVF